MSKIYTSFEEVKRAYNKVRTELWNMGVLWKGSKLDKVPCIYDVIAPFAAITGTMGWYNRKKKTITFPSVYLPIMSLWVDLGTKANALDVLRHEFAHAIADLYQKEVSFGGRFCAAFGGACGDKPSKDKDLENWGDVFVSAYAKKYTEEDFAETFMLYMKHKGKIPAKFAKKSAIRQKWKVVGEIMRRVSASTR